MEIDPKLEREAIREGLTRYPDLGQYGPTLTWKPLFQGGAFQLQYRERPPADHPDAWEFQNAVVRAYKRLAGVSAA